MKSELSDEEIVERAEQRHRDRCLTCEGLRQNLHDNGNELLRIQLDHVAQMDDLRSQIRLLLAENARLRFGAPQ